MSLQYIFKLQYNQFFVRLLAALQMIEKIQKTKNKCNYLSYSISALIYGLFEMSVGSIIPYLAQQSGKKQTQYFFLLACKGYAMLLTALGLTYLKRKAYCSSNHKLLMIGIIMIGLSSLIFAFVKNPLEQGVLMSIGSVGMMIICVQINIAAIYITEKDSLQFCLQIIWGIYSVGAIIVPNLVYLLDKKTYYLIFILSLLNSLFFPFLKSSQLINKQIDNNSQDLKNTQKQDTSDENKLKDKENKNNKVMSNIIYYKLCGLMFMYIALIINLVLWTPSYAVIANVCTKQYATIFPFIFWLINTAFKFIIAFIPYKSSKKIKYSLLGVIIGLLISLIMIKINYSLQSLYFQSIILGIFLSPTYAAIFSIGGEFGYKLQGFQASNITTFGALGQALIVPLTGVLMQIHMNALFLLMLVLACVMSLLLYSIIRQFKAINEDSQTKDLSSIDATVEQNQ